MRQEGQHVGAGELENAGEQRRGALPIHVIVAMDQNSSAATYRADDCLDRLRHSGKPVRVGQLG